MDADRFDTVARSLTAAGSRRRALAALGGALGLLGVAIPDDATAARSRKCQPKCAECEKCQKGDCERKNGKKVCKRGKCKPKTNGTACGNGRQCQNGACVCPGGLTDCGGTCVNLSSDPRNCGSCGKRCQVNGVCTAGTCGCANQCSDPGLNCCPPGSPVDCTGFNANNAEGKFTDLSDCGFTTECPEAQRCVGPRFQACCPVGSTCDPSTGTCLRN